jgi:hypothetical protein
MPSGISKNNPTFNRSNESGLTPGYYSRTIFSCGGSSIGNDNLHFPGDSDINVNGGDGIQWLIDNYPDYCWGSHKFPSNYWLAGKSVRIKGNCLVYGYPEEEEGQYTQFNMSVGLIELGTNNIVTLANSFSSNRFPLTSGEEPVPLCPVDFEYIITCATPDYDGNAVWFASGYYHYNYTDYNTNGENGTENVYVPVCYRYPPSVGLYNTSTDYIIQPTRILFNFYDSNIYYLYLTALTVEELA